MLCDPRGKDNCLGESREASECKGHLGWFWTDEQAEERACVKAQL